MQKYFFIAGVIVLAVAGYVLYQQSQPADWTEEFTHTSEEFHTHGDFLVYIGATKLDFSQDKYQSTAEQILHSGVHLHDNQGDVIHLHEDGVSLGEFFNSLDFFLTDSCFTLDTGNEYCEDEEMVLNLYVNGEPYEDKVNYVLNDADRILLYVGHPEQPLLQQYLNEISDRACIYSGTCPERGTPPPEECGLTCEL